VTLGRFCKEEGGEEEEGEGDVVEESDVSLTSRLRSKSMSSLPCRVTAPTLEAQQHRGGIRIHEAESGMRHIVAFRYCTWI
jgi:hypothetical protein